MTNTVNVWEQLRHVTLDQLVTHIKLGAGSALSFHGFTTPEGYPWAIMVAVGSTPANELAVAIVKEAGQILEGMTAVRRADNPQYIELPPLPKRSAS